MYLDIAICDDNEKDRGILETLLHSICSEWNLTARILHYSSGEEFLSAQAGGDSSSPLQAGSTPWKPLP